MRVPTTWSLLQVKQQLPFDDLAVAREQLDRKVAGGGA